jgi:hypothetical protein
MARSRYPLKSVQWGCQEQLHFLAGQNLRQLARGRFGSRFCRFCLIYPLCSNNCKDLQASDGGVRSDISAPVSHLYTFTSSCSPVRANAQFVQQAITPNIEQVGTMVFSTLFLIG